MKAAGTIVRFAVRIREAILSWRGVALLTRGVKAVVDLAKSRREMNRLKGLGGKKLQPSSATLVPLSKGQWMAEYDALHVGKQQRFREMETTEDMRKLFDRWVLGQKRLPGRNQDIAEVYELEDGTQIQWRIDSKTGGPAIDVVTKEGSVGRVHLPWKR